MRTPLDNEKGFTLIETCATLVMVGMLSAIAVKKVNAHIELERRVSKSQVVRELNARSMGTWCGQLISNPGFKSDQDIFENLDTDLTNVTWEQLTRNGGRFKVNGQVFEITRNPATAETAATWK